MTGHRPTARTPVQALVAVMVAVALAGTAPAHAEDDIESLSAQQISDRAKEAMLSATSVHISTEGDLRPAGSTSELDLTMDRDGNCAGTVSTGAKGSVEIIKRGDTVWMKPDELFWKSQVPGAGEQAAELFKDRYLRGSTKDSMLKSMADVCDLDRLLNSIADSPDMKVPLTKGGTTKIDGVDVITVTGKREGRTTTMYVATEGEPYPVRLETTAGSAKASITLSAYDEPVPSATPPADKSVDISRVSEQEN
ncbi:hypothetical protein [Streptomyces sp. NPDC002133]|uniref:hypothetical protein n=1 Tax=Streptomyces sp. NPDC002133 TaxID=3154409 RepID=UPI003317A45B